jgi:hypothetical protein
MLRPKCSKLLTSFHPWHSHFSSSRSVPSHFFRLPSPTPRPPRTTSPRTSPSPPTPLPVGSESSSSSKSASASSQPVMDSQRCFLLREPRVMEERLVECDERRGEGWDPWYLISETDEGGENPYLTFRALSDNPSSWVISCPSRPPVKSRPPSPTASSPSPLNLLALESTTSEATPNLWRAIPLSSPSPFVDESECELYFGG